MRTQLLGWLEIVPQALLLSALLCFWINHRDKKWLGRLLTISFGLLMILFGYSLAMGRH